MRSVVRLTASATSALPRWLLLAICIVYASFGLFGRDPWKNEDAAGFGVMWTMANGDAKDWLLPNLVGKALTGDGPLMYWLGATSIRLLSPWVDASNASRVVTGLLFCLACAFVWYTAYLLGRRDEAQPFKYAFGGEPEPRDYGRTLADGALLILLACFGLAERGHETTPQLAQFAGSAMLVYGLVRSIDKPVQGALTWGAAIGVVGLSSSPVLVFALLLSTLAMTIIVRQVRPLPLVIMGLPVAVVLIAAWVLPTLHFYPDDGEWWLRQWWRNSFHTFTGPPTEVLGYAMKNLPLFTWPAWPLAIWTFVSWGGQRRSPHVAVPLSVIGPLLVLVVLQSHETNRLFMLLLPPLSVLATFALPTLKRGAINAIDWFAMLSFTILGTFVWLVWTAGMIGFPRAARAQSRTARAGLPFRVQGPVVRLRGGGHALLVPACALAPRPSPEGAVAQRRAVERRHHADVGAAHDAVAAGRELQPDLSRRRRADRRPPAARLHAASRRCVSATRRSRRSPTSAACISPSTKTATCCCARIARITASRRRCSAFVWKLVWEGRRVADRDERFRLYVRIERPVPPVKKPRPKTLRQP